ncbi:MAG: hypothetical protein C0179_03690 [Fervidicoccus sp.]|nr:MAG: hypothetical protein C0179_03690 [Fervidicoccus sp.]
MFQSYLTDSCIGNLSFILNYKDISNNEDGKTEVNSIYAFNAVEWSFVRNFLHSYSSQGDEKGFNSVSEP